MQLSLDGHKSRNCNSFLAAHSRSSSAYKKRKYDIDSSLFLEKHRNSFDFFQYDDFRLAVDAKSDLADRKARFFSKIDPPAYEPPNPKNSENEIKELKK